MMALRSYLFVAWLYGWMAICGILYLPTMLLPRVAAQRCIRLYAQIIRVGLKLICNIDTEIRGREHIPQGPFLYAGKHHCMLDIFIPFIVTSDPAIVLKRELLFYPFLGWYALKTQMIPIDRAGTSKTLKAMIAAAKDRAAKGRPIVIFPEGTRTEPGAAPDYKPGVAAIYRDLDGPCWPVATNSGVHWPAHGFRRYPGTVVFEFLEPVPAGLKRPEFMGQLEEKIEGASGAMLQPAPIR